MKTFYAGVDIGGTNTVFGLVDADGNCTDTETIPTEPNAEKLIEEVAAGIGKMMKNHPDGKLLGIGMGAPDANHYTGMVVSPPNLQWKDFNIVREMKKHYELPVSVTNDANAAAIGEKLYGAGVELKNFIVITLGTGLGSGIVVDGKILHGAFGYAGEIGHMTAVPGGRLCGCGRRGCLETYVSAQGLKRTALELLAETNDSGMLMKIKPEELTSERIFQFAEAGDSLSREVFEKTGKMLGQKLADVALALEPEAIFLFGGPAKAGDLILEPTRKAFEESLLPVFRRKIKIMLSGLLDKNIAVLGASALIREIVEHGASVK